MNYTDNYRDTQIMTASPMELIIMLYNECINSLEKAEERFNSDHPDRIEEINNRILHAQSIIAELIVSLDMDNGGEIAKNLERLYDFMITKLSEANVEKVVTPITEVGQLMNELREAWEEIAKEEHKEDKNIRPTGTEGILFAG